MEKTSRDDILSFQAKPAESKSVLDSAVKMPTAKLESLLSAYRIAEETTQDPLLSDWDKRLAAVPQMYSEVTVSQKVANQTTFPQTRPVDSGYHVSDLIPVLHPLDPPENPEAVLRGEITLPPHHLQVPKNMPVAIGDNLVSPDLTVKSKEASAKLERIGLSSIKLPAFNTSESRSGTGAVSATVMQSLILPSAPTTPNVLAGIVVTSDGQIADGTIIEIRRLSDHLPVRGR